jgi:hypothetical protein
VHIETRAAREGIVERCDRLGFEHSPVQDRGPNEAVVDVPDPDGTVLRFYWQAVSDDDDRFMGLAFDDAGEVTFYDTPQLTVPVQT